MLAELKQKAKAQWEKFRSLGRVRQFGVVAVALSSLQCRLGTHGKALLTVDCSYLCFGTFRKSGEREEIVQL